jgi:hypothetical protein
MFDKLAVEVDPFPRFSCPDLLPASQYLELRDSWPTDVVADCALRDKSGLGFSPLSRLRKQDLKQHRNRLARPWLEWLDELHAGPFKVAAAKYFGPYIRLVYGQRYDFEVRAQLVECSGRDHAHRVIGPHIDTESTLWVLEIFFPCLGDEDTSGGFDYYRWTGAPDWRGNTVKANPEAVELIDSAPYLPNRLCGFVNGTKSLHSSGLRQPSPYPRRYVSISGHTEEILFRRR